MQNDITVIIRILLYVAAGRLTAGGWLPAGIADDPALIEAVTGVVIGSATLGWWKLAQWRGWAT